MPRMFFAKLRSALLFALSLGLVVGLFRFAGDQTSYAQTGACGRQLDVVFVIDHSSSVFTNRDIDKIIAATNKILTTFQGINTKSPGTIQAGYVRFGSQAVVVSSLTDNLDLVKKRVNADKNKVMGPPTNIANALAVGNRVLESGGLGRAKILVLLSDGESEGNVVSPSETKMVKEASRIKNAGTEIYSIAFDVPTIRPELDKWYQRMRLIASDPKEKYFFVNSRQLSYDSIFAAIANDVCPPPNPSPSPSPSPVEPCKTPTDVMFVVDTSGSMGQAAYPGSNETKLKETQEAIGQALTVLASQNASGGDVRAGVVEFKGRNYDNVKHANLTKDFQQVQQNVVNTFQASGTTDIGGGIARGYLMLKGAFSNQPWPSDRANRQHVMVLLSDGNSLVPEGHAFGDRQFRDNALKIRRDNISLYSIGYINAGSALPHEHIMRAVSGPGVTGNITPQSNPHYYVKNTTDFRLGEIFTKLAEDIPCTNKGLPFDLSVRVEPATLAVNKNDTVPYKVHLTNNGPADLSGKEVEVTLTTPAMLVTEQPAPIPTTITEPPPKKATKVQWRLVVGSLAPGETVSTFAVSYQADLAAGAYTVTGCANLTNQDIDRFETNRANNCQDASLVVDQIKVDKSWSDGSLAPRKAEPATELAFTAKAKNLSDQSVTSVNLADLLSVVCNQEFPDSCTPTPPWDDSLAWADTAGGDISGNRRSWNAISLAAGGERKFDLKGKLVDAASLLAKVSRFGYDRCNSFGQTAGSQLSPESKVCWYFNLPYDLEIHKEFTSGGKQKQIARGGLDQYEITLKNNGPNPSFNTTVTDIQHDTHSSQLFGQPPAHHVFWVPSELDGGTSVSDHKVEWTVDGRDGQADNRFDPGKTITLKPKFVVRCNAPIGATVANQVIASASRVTDLDTNRANNNNGLGDVVITIVDEGKYNLAFDVTPSKEEIAPGESIQLKVLVTNKPAAAVTTVTKPVPHVKITITLPSQLIIKTTGPDFTEQGNQLIWNIPLLEAGGERKTEVTVEAKSGSLGTANIRAKAESPAGTCGAHDPDAWSETFRLPNGLVDDPIIKIVGANLILTKQPQKTDFEKGESGDFVLQITNDSPTAVSEAISLLDQLDPAFDFAATTAECKVLSPPTSQSPVDCDNAKQQVKPDKATSELKWTINEIPANTAIRYIATLKVRDDYDTNECPKVVSNAIKLKNSDGGDIGNPSSPINVNIYVGRCVKGNVHAQSSTGTGNIQITGSDVIIDSTSILSATGSITCQTDKCNVAPWKIGDYNTKDSVGIALSRLVRRLSRNISRLSKQVKELPTTTIENRQFNLHTGGSGSACEAGKYPDGRVWTVTGRDLKITTGVVFACRGTIIIKGGNLTIEGSGEMKYLSESKKHSVGFIVLPPDNNTTVGNVTVGPEVTRLVGAYAALGTNSDQLPPPTATSGTFTFVGPGSKRLKAKGLFMARSFDIRRGLFAMEYDERTASPDSAPPGFTFSGSPGQTEEGS